MKKKILSGFLALVFLLQAFLPSFAYANQAKPQDTKLISEDFKGSDNTVTIGKLKGVGFSKDNPTASISIEEVKEKNRKNTDALDGLEIGDEIIPQALRSTKSPYIQGQQPADPDKPKYCANVQGTLTTRGIDGTTFDWEKVLGKGQKVKLLFTQTNGNVMTGIRFYLEVDKDGTYAWQGSDGKPTYLPLYDVDGNPYTYNVQIERNFSENVQLIIQESNGTPKAQWRQEGDKQVATISSLDIEIQQVASTKFVSEWHTGVNEADRPQIEGYFKVDDETDNDFNFPKNDTTRTILRYSFLENFVEDEENGPWAFISDELEKTPEKVEVKTDTQGLTFEETDGVKTVKSGDHKFKYDFTYGVINGGKLTMTEIIPVTFDANGGKFENFTAPDTDTNIVKDVDYKEDLTEKAEDPKREGKTFKGWSTKADGKTPATDDDFKNITEKKTFYAIWENNDIKAEELTVSESFNNGTVYVNDFIPSIEALKGQVEIKDANGVYQKLKDGDSLQILDDSGNPIADDDLKDKLYDKLKEDTSTEISRNLTLKAKVNFADGTSQEIEIPIKVIKNIYEGTSTGGKPSYVPENYVKVTVDPTDKATNPQKTYYYVNPAAKVVIPGGNPTGTEGNVFTKWTMKADDATGEGSDYKLTDRHQFTEASIITAQYEKEKQGIVNIAYIDENGNEISADYHKDGVEYPDKKYGKIGVQVQEADFPKPGPKFEGYVFSTRSDLRKVNYADPEGMDIPTIKYIYYKKVTTEDKSTSDFHFKVVFDGNGGKFGTDTTKDVYVYFAGDSTPETVTFAEVREEVEKAFGKPTKDKAEFKEWQDKAADGAKVADNYVINAPDWDYDSYPELGYNPETFYAHYEQAGAFVKYLDLNGKPIADYFKIDGVEYPTEKEGTLDEAIASDVFTKDTAPKFIGYKFNRIELNPANSKYALDNKATIKIYYEKLPDVIPAQSEDGSDRPAGYVTVTFKLKGGTEFATFNPGETTVYYVDPNREVNLKQPQITLKSGYKFQGWDKTRIGTRKYTEDTTILGHFEGLPNIVPSLDENNKPIEKPKGYVTVTFEPGENGQFTGDKQTVYYVNPKTNVRFHQIPRPDVTPNVGYKHKYWDKDRDLKITKDITVTATYTKDEDVIPKTKDDGTENKKPDGYVTVKLIPTDKATDETKAETIYYVNPTKEVTLPSKDPVGKKVTDKNGNTYTYMFKNWTVSKGTILPPWDKPETGDTEIKGTFAEETEITAKYNVKAEPLVNGPKAKENPITEKDKLPDPKDLIKNPYDPTDPDNKDNLPEGTTFTYTPDGTPDVSQPGKSTAKVEVKYPNDKTVIVEVPITVVDNVVPQTGDEKPNVPADYVKVTFEIEGEGGKIADGETTIYYVNPKQAVTISQPNTEADTGYTFNGWDKDTTKDATYTTDTIVKGSFENLKDVIPKTNDDGTENKKPDGYVTITFNKGANGSLEGQTVYYVNPNAGKTLKDVTHPTIKPNTGFTVNGWDKEDTTAISGTSDITVTAQYAPIADVIPMTKDDGSENDKPEGYVTVTFDKGAHGTLEGKTVYYVNPKVAVALEGAAPKVHPNTGYAFARWDVSIDQAIQYKDGTVITALYNDPGNISTKEIDGYVKVEFKPGDHGTLSGTTEYWVKPGVGVTILEPRVNPAEGYQFDKWDKSLTVKLAAGDSTYTITAQYEKQKPVDPTPTPRPDPVPQPSPTPGDCNKACDQPNQPNKPNQPNVGKDALNTTDHYQYLIGYPDGNFGPNKGMTRAEAATMFTRLLNERPVKWRHYNAGLTDIRPGDWYANTVGYAVQRGIVSGYPDGSFKPNKPITRAEFAAIASRFDALAQGNDIAFSDLAPSHWGYNAIRSAATKGWISGYPDNTFRPEQAITRAEVTAITNRMLNRHADLYWIDAHPSEVIRFGDVKRSDWYFEPIMEATMGHDFIRDRDGKTEHWTGINGKSFI